MIQHGIYLTWNDLSADVKGKKILNNVSGYCIPGSTLAIMGPSGAGKTTMLSILAKKYGNNVNISGTVLVSVSEGSRQ
jgi:ABC-type multidrug transport system ATPase subunit